MKNGSAPAPKSSQAVMNRSLLRDVREMIAEARSSVAVTVNAGLAILYWRIGERIRKDILQEKRAAYGREIVATLARQLETEFGRGFGRRNLFRMVRFAETFPDPQIVSSLMTQLGWTHFLMIIPLKDQHDGSWSDSFTRRLSTQNKVLRWKPHRESGGQRSADYADDTDDNPTDRTGGIAMRPSKVQEFGQSAKSISVEKMRDPQTYAIIGAAMEVHRVLGCGFLEPVYQEALAKEFLLRGIPFRREVELPITYKGDLLAVKYKPDFICYETVIVELKALDRLSNKEKAQVINYLKATAIERGLLLNFGTVRLEYERLILTARYSSADYADDTDQELQERPDENL